MEKYIKYLSGLCLFCVLCVSCQDGDWEAPTGYTLWNDTITERNVVDLATLKAKYKDAISNSSYALIEEDVQLKGVVTVNDEGGNISQQLVVKDNTGYIILGITETSMYSYVKPGQQFLLNLKGLYIGGYGMNGQIGYPSMSSTSGAKRIGRMPREEWYKHVKFLGTPDKSLVPAPIEFSPTMNKDQYSDYLVYVEGTFDDADGEAILAPAMEADAGNAVNRVFRMANGSTVDVRTSTYSDFGSMIIPQGKVRVTGVAIRYNDSAWQLQMRTEKDIEEIKD